MLDIAERRKPQDGRISLSLGNKKIDVRISTLPSSYGERVVLRILDKESANVDIDSLGYNDEILSKYNFEQSVVFVGLSGEEQGLFGGKGLAEYAKVKGWDIIGILNSDMIGNIKGVDGYISNKDFRIFSEPVPVTESERNRRARRFYGGEVDGPSRQIAR